MALLFFFSNINFLSPLVVVVTVIASANQQCAGSATGFVTVRASGGNGGFTFAVSVPLHRNLNS